MEQDKGLRGHTFHLHGLNSWGFLWSDGSRFTAAKMGRTFQPAGIRYPASYNKQIHSFVNFYKGLNYFLMINL